MQRRADPCLGANGYPSDLAAQDHIDFTRRQQSLKLLARPFPWASAHPRRFEQRYARAWTRKDRMNVHDRSLRTNTCCGLITRSFYRPVFASRYRLCGRRAVRVSQQRDLGTVASSPAATRSTRECRRTSWRSQGRRLLPLRRRPHYRPRDVPCGDDGHGVPIFAITTRDPAS